MRSLLRHLAGGLIGVALALPARAEPSVAIVPLSFKATAFRGPESRLATVLATTDALREERTLAGQRIVAVWGAGGGAALSLAGGAVRIVPLGGSVADLARIEHAPNAIPDARTAVNGPLTVVLAEPNRDYPHEALGSSVHAGALLVFERKPVAAGGGPARVPTETARVPAGPGAVFEDREPRLADLDGDGRPEIVVVRSVLGRGSSLAVVGRSDAGGRLAAETPPTGETALWLNPAAIADFAGAGRPQIAVVRTPHRDGLLELWEYRAGSLTLRAQKAGYSDHAFGQSAQDLAAAIDLDGPGSPPLLVVPTLGRDALAILSLANGVTERERIALPAPAALGVAVLGTGRNAHILVGLEDGRVADVRP